jgi:hypothetical protein
MVKRYSLFLERAVFFPKALQIHNQLTTCRLENWFCAFYYKFTRFFIMFPGQYDLRSTIPSGCHIFCQEQIPIVIRIRNSRESDYNFNTIFLLFTYSHIFLQDNLHLQANCLVSMEMRKEKKMGTIPSLCAKRELNELL